LIRERIMVAEPETGPIVGGRGPGLSGRLSQADLANKRSAPSSTVEATQATTDALRHSGCVTAQTTEKMNPAIKPMGAVSNPQAKCRSGSRPPSTQAKAITRAQAQTR
jgi:hypothetical protein